MSGFEALLALQENDTTIDRIEHRLATLPEHAALEAVRATIGTVTAERATVQARRDELAREQKRIEDEVALVEAKAAEVDATLYGGTVTSPKELQAFQDDFAALKRRQSELEDHVIEVMEAAEPVDAELAALDARLAALATDETDAAAALDAAAGAAAAELEAARSARPGMVDAVPPALLAEYDRLRPQLGGVAVARFVGTTCHGCHLSLASATVDQIRHAPPDAVVHCEECGRILVR